jgi:hypothetical protein
MSAAFLYVRGADAAHAAAYLPFVPESSVTLALPEGAALHVWSTLDEAAGGAWHVADARGWLAWDGWVDDAPREGLVASWLAGRLGQLGAAGVVQQHAGEFALVAVSPGGEVTACGDFLGARHLYYAQRAGVTAISNRAMLVSAALERGAPCFEPMHLSWLMCSIACMFAEQTVWRGVRALGAGCVLRSDGAALRVTPTPVEASELSWEAHWERLCARLSGLVGRGGLPTRVAVTGGKDSRVVLAGLVGSGMISRVDVGYLRIAAGHPDAVVAQRLCARYGLRFERLEAPDMAAEPVEALLDRHNFQSEHALHAWDLKGAASRPREIGLHGNYGEIYRSHALLRFVLGWPEIRRKYLSPGYYDLYDVMTPPARQHVREGLSSWLQERRDEGVSPLQLHDRLHRAARMHRWVGQAAQVDGAGGMSANPIPSPALMRRYLDMSLAEQRRHRVHFELVRRADDWLWRQPFAQASWPRGAAPLWARLPAPVTATAGGPPSRQRQLWSAQRDALRALLVAPGGADFHVIFDRAKVSALLAETMQRPTDHNIRAVLGLAGIRRSLEGGFEPHAAVMEAR